MKRFFIAVFLLLWVTPCLAQLPMTGAGKGAPGGGGGGGCSQATSFLARTSGLNGTHTTAYTNLICGLVTDGVFSKLDALYIFATQSSGNAVLNLVSSSFNATVNGTPTFTADQGYKANAGGDYLDSGFNASSAPSPQFTQNSAHLGIGSNNNTSFTNPAIGNSGGSTTTVYIDFTGTDFYGRINDSSPSSSYTIASSIGVFVANRSSSSAIQAYQNGSSLGSQSSTSGSVGTSDIRILSADGTSSDTAHQICAASIGSSLSSTDAANFSTRLHTYMTAIGSPGC